MSKSLFTLPIHLLSRFKSLASIVNRLDHQWGISYDDEQITFNNCQPDPAIETQLIKWSCFLERTRVTQERQLLPES